MSAHKHIGLQSQIGSAKIHHTWLNFTTSTAISKAASWPSLFQAGTIKGLVLSAQGTKMWCLYTQKTHLIGGVAMVTATRSDREGVNERDKQVVLFSFSVDSAPSDRILKGWDSFTHLCIRNMAAWITHSTCVAGRLCILMKRGVNCENSWCRSGRKSIIKSMQTFCLGEKREDANML